MSSGGSQRTNPVKRVWLKTNLQGGSTLIDANILPLEATIALLWYFIEKGNCKLFLLWLNTSTQ